MLLWLQLKQLLFLFVLVVLFFLLHNAQIAKFGLELLTGTRFFNGYNRRVNAQMTAGFSVASYRFGHTLIQEWFRRFNQRSFQNTESESEFRPIPVLDFENPQYLYETCQGGVDAILRGLIKDPAGKLDGYVNTVLLWISAHALISALSLISAHPLDK